MNAHGDASAERGLLVSIHDVTPAFEREVRTLWDQCGHVGITPALFVVPNWHGQWRLERSPRFVQWLHGCVAQGAEIFLHGERHDEVHLPRRLLDEWRALGCTKREGEFLTLDADAARDRLLRGIDVLRSLHFNPVGFVPPAWLARESTHAEVCRLGLRFSEDATSIRIHDARTQYSTRWRVPVVRWSGRTALRATLSHVVAGMRWRFQRRSPLMRVALHPQDLQHPTTALSVRMALMRWSRHLPTRSYGQLP
jgi:hypothetical protein